MKHGVKKGRRFGRTKQQRDAMFNAMAISLIEHEAITTTEAKAKDLLQVIEPMITRARSGTIASRRVLARRLSDTAVKKLVDQIAPQYVDRPGGYTRITHLRHRDTDGARMARIEFVK